MAGQSDTAKQVISVGQEYVVNMSKQNLYVTRVVECYLSLGKDNLTEVSAQDQFPIRPDCLQYVIQPHVPHSVLRNGTRLTVQPGELPEEERKTVRSLPRW